VGKLYCGRHDRMVEAVFCRNYGMSYRRCRYFGGWNAEGVICRYKDKE
jgi:hypothetical protein